MLEEKDKLIHRSHFEKKNKPRKYAARLLLVVIIIFGIVGFIFIFFKKDNTQTLSSEDHINVLEKVSNIMLIPEEEPYVFTITDINALLEDQKFFSGAENGDILFIFSESAKAIIYSPSRNIIVNTGPVIANDIISEKEQQLILQSTESNEISAPLNQEVIE